MLQCVEVGHRIRALVEIVDLESEIGGHQAGFHHISPPHRECNPAKSVGSVSISLQGMDNAKDHLREED